MSHVEVDEAHVQFVIDGLENLGKTTLFGLLRMADTVEEARVIQDRLRAKGWAWDASEEIFKRAG